MKTLNVLPLDWNSPDVEPDRTWVIEDSTNKNFNWVDGMFHSDIFKRADLDIKYNHIESIDELKNLSDNNLSYNIFVKAYQFRHLIGTDATDDNIVKELSFFHYYFNDKKYQFIIDDIKSGKCNLIFALLTEFSNECYYMYYDVFTKLLKEYDIPENRVVVFDFMNNIEKIPVEYNSEVKFKYYNWLMVAWEHYVSLPKTQSNFKNKDYIRDKYYITLNKSVTKQHRLFLMHFLWKYNLVDKGFVSFFHEKDNEEYRSQFFGNMTNNDDDVYFEILNSKEVQTFYNWLNDNPLWVDVSWEEFKKFSEHHEYHSSAPNEVFIDKTDNAYKNSYFNILTESYFIESQIFFNSQKKLVEFSLNERNILPINAYQPFIAMNGQGHMKGLRDLGFKTFHPYIDESYDDVVNVHKRFNMIKQEINKLCSMSKQEIHDWYWSMEEIYKHNFNHLHNVFYPTQIKGFFDEFIFE
jgi:hypothetical protein